MLKKGIRLIYWIVSYSFITWLLIKLLALGGTVLVNILSIPLTLGYVFLWFFFGYTIREGFGKGIIIGFIGAIPAIFFTLVQTFMLSAGTDVTLTPFSIINLTTMPLIGFFNAFQQWGIHVKYIPHILTPVLILLCGIGSYFGSLKKSR